MADLAAYAKNNKEVKFFLFNFTDLFGTKLSMQAQGWMLAAFALIGGLLDLPFELYNTFRIEQRFGFNRITPKLFAIDLLKNTLVGALVGLPLAALGMIDLGAVRALWQSPRGLHEQATQLHAALPRNAGAAPPRWS